MKKRKNAANPRPLPLKRLIIDSLQGATVTFSREGTCTVKSPQHSSFPLSTLVERKLRSVQVKCVSGVLGCIIHNWAPKKKDELGSRYAEAVYTFIPVDERPILNE
jgi:hypothetical protein